MLADGSIYFNVMKHCDTSTVVQTDARDKFIECIKIIRVTEDPTSETACIVYKKENPEDK